MNALLRPVAEVAEAQVRARKGWLTERGNAWAPTVAGLQEWVDEMKAGRDVATLLGVAKTVGALRRALRRDQPPEC
jgi:hypothetical protein